MLNPIPDEALNSHIKKPKERHLPDPRPCARCGQLFYVRVKYQQQRFCSPNCSVKTVLPPDHNARVARASAEKRGAAMRGRGEGKTYRKKMGRHEHRRVAEEMLGRPLRPGEVVHHKDGDKLNNDPSNLEVMLQGEHMREHGLGVPGVAPAHEPWRARWGK